MDPNILAEARTSSDDESFDENSDYGDEDDVINQAKITSLDEKINKSPYDYQAHVDRIRLLRKCGEFQKLCTARKAMSEIFPLTQELWIDWLEDEQKFAETEEEHKQVEELFEAAVKDYICPEVWLEYAQYSIRFIGSNDGFKKIRSIMERALSAVGLHVSKGSSIWEAYREIENAILMTFQPMPGAITTPEVMDQINQLERNIEALFCRQLAVPLLDMEATMTEYLDWRCKSLEDGDLPVSTQQAYEKALKLLQELKPLEEALTDAAVSDKLETYQAYIALEMKSDDPARIQCIFERAIAANCLNSDLWIQYLKYLSRTLKSGPIVLSVHERAVKNCPWTSELWRMHLLALEKCDASIHQLEAVCDEALAAGFSSAGDYAYLWQTWCDQARRRYCSVENTQDKDEMARCLRSTFEKSTSHLLNTILPAFGETGDPDYTLWSYWARCEACFLGNMAKARMILEELMQGHAEARRNWKIWVEYYEIERLYGSLEHARAVLRQAVQSSAADDGCAEAACLYFIRFERENGTLDELEDAMKKVEQRLAKVQKRKDKVAMLAHDKRRPREQNRQMPKKWGKDNINHNRDKRATKRQSVDVAGTSSPTKKRKFDTLTEKESFKTPNLPIRFTKSSSKAQEESVKVNVKPISGPPPGFHPGMEDVPTSSAQSKHEVRTPASEERTVFVSNISYKVESLEDKLKQLFSPCGEVISIRAARGHKGNFRGFAYVEFENKSMAKKALELDRQLFDERPIFISPNVDKSKQPDFKMFKYDTGMERHKLFVSGLCFDTTEDKLREVFSTHGTLKSLRIVTARSGKSKGLAYVEYENEADASQAVIKTDQLELDGFIMKVAISNPPARKRDNEERVKALGGGDRSQVYGSRGRGRTQLSMVPRALQKSSMTRETRSEDASNNGPSEKMKPMSNSDFSSLLTKN